MLPLEEARERILSLVPLLDIESLPVLEAAGRITVENSLAACDLPPFDNSAMDGYAVKADDTAGASRPTPVILRLAGQTAAGQVFPGTLSHGECVRVFTGSPLPAGADAVVMQEDTEPSPAGPEEIRLLCPVDQKENVRFQGRDVGRGTVLVRSGERLKASQIGLLAAAGCGTISVRRKPLIGLIATGNELSEPGRDLGPGQIYESNRASLGALCADAGAVPRAYPLVPDEFEATRRALRRALDECDAVVTSGGVSVGELDLVRAVFSEIGGELAFWKVAIKPGKPFALGKCQGKLLFALPGNPVSAFVTFLLLVHPALQRMQGAAQELLPRRAGVLAEPLENPGDRRHFVRVILDQEGHVRAAGPQASHMLSSLARANGLADLPPQTRLQPGARISVLCWQV